MSRRLIYAYFADVFNNYTSSTIIKMKRGVLAKSFEGQRSHWAMTKKKLVAQLINTSNI